MTGYIGWLLYVVSMCAAMPFTAKVTDAIYPERVFSAADWLAMWFFNLFAALLWPFILTAVTVRKWVGKR